MLRWPKPDNDGPRSCLFSYLPYLVYRFHIPDGASADVAHYKKKFLHGGVGRSGENVPYSAFTAWPTSSQNIHRRSKTLMIVVLYRCAVARGSIVALFFQGQSNGNLAHYRTQVERTMSLLALPNRIGLSAMLRFSPSRSSSSVLLLPLPPPEQCGAT